VELHVAAMVRTELWGLFGVPGWSAMRHVPLKSLIAPTQRDPLSGRRNKKFFPTGFWATARSSIEPLDDFRRDV
jgi:hypothetical protein